jgi:hypothetical protein
MFRAPEVKSLKKSVSERGAAWLAHQSGGLGVVGSNPAAPTIHRSADRAAMNAKARLASA